MAETKEARLRKIHSEAMAEFDRIQTAVRDERMQCLSDRRFYSISGAQWEGDLGEQFANRPRFEFNRVHLAVIRIFNEWRNNRITVDFTPKDGTSKADLADTCDGLYRADEQDSGAQEAYDNAFEEAGAGGFGAWRLRACYEDEEDDENERQRIKIEPIFDADSCVFFDLDAKRQDKADATRCFVLTAMTPGAFEAQFGHHPSDWPREVHQREFDWSTPDVVYVADYYRVEETTETVHVFRSLDGQEKRVRDHELKEDEELLGTLTATGWRKVREKKAKRRRVHKYILSGAKVEEDEGYIAGKCIPVIPVFGKRWVVDGVERCMGHVRLAKDAQRLMNSLLTWLAEIAGRFDIEKPILTPEQIAGHAQMWADDNIKRYPYLLINPMRDADGNPVPAGPVAYTKAPNIPPPMAALIQLASQALTDLLGNQESGEQMMSNVSGKTVELIQQRLDMQTYIYMSNMAKGMKRCGEVWLSIARDVLVEDGRQMKTVQEDGSPDTVTLRTPMVDESGAEYLENDLTAASFDVWVDVGPSSNSRRQATVRALTQMTAITTNEEDRAILTAATLMNLEGEGLGDINAHYRKKMVRMGVTKPTDEEKAELQAEMQGRQPDPQSQYLLAAAEQAQADAAQARAKTVDTIAAADLKRAQTAETWATVMGEAQAQELASLQTLQGVLAGRMQ